MEGGSPLTPGVASTVLGLLRENAPARSGISPSQLDLTERELEVLRCLVDGCRYSEAAEILGIGAETVKSHVHSVYRKLQVRSAASAVREALRRGLV
ncbi:MAG: hypothetical protein GTN89_12815 [Acidobacteria bacterium]|nr:hypothetical protein [Acidobacteriota bacterium]NIM63886.1 hypothetical protein [Acidobacteriota bacterium]NIO60155.1 hypothetical protein [Acidobacteriota bacterium]NIQ31219.1 hypothetical protein [Acidobacteriota bacterium]NIQ86356.1 hypothetical protein [Acidobacteriota bacterium]